MIATHDDHARAQLTAGLPEEWNDAATAATPVGLLAVDRTCSIVWANAAALALIGAPPEGRRLCDVLLPTRCPRPGIGSCLCAHALAGTERRFYPRWVTLMVAGAHHAVLFRSTSLYSPGALPGVTTPIGAAVTIIPDQLVDHADRRRRELLAAAIHDMRHPITIQTLTLDLLEGRRQELPPGIEPYLAKMRHATAVLATVIDDLLNRMLFELQAHTLQPVALQVRPLLQSLAWQLDPILLRRKQRLAIACPASLQVHADPTALEHMLTNLVLNAYKYSVDEDTIVLGGRSLPRSAEAEIFVRDHGPGVPKEDRQRIFTRYYRGGGAERQRGAGLGLSIVASLAEQLGGRAGVRPPPGNGAVFWIRLPRPSASEHEGAQ